MKRSGQADLPLHPGKVPAWLYERMAELGGAMAEVIISEYGVNAFLSRLSNPFWFQSFGAVLGMDWHSSGITTSVLGALKKALNPLSRPLGVYVCGGRGKASLQTPAELEAVARVTGLEADRLVRTSRLTAKVDNTAVQDGFQLYLHVFILSKDGNWVVIQQGMNGDTGMARRYHWHSDRVWSFVEEPHSAVCGDNQGLILNLTHRQASSTRNGILSLVREQPRHILQEARSLVMPGHHPVKEQDVDLKRLGAVLAVAYEKRFEGFEDLLLLEGLGPRTLRSLTLVSELIHGTPVRFRDPARFSFAHGGKDGHPFPVQTSVYDDTIIELRNALKLARIGYTDKAKAIKRLSALAWRMEPYIIPDGEKFRQFREEEVRQSPRLGGRTAGGFRAGQVQAPCQLALF